jgi:ubiquinone/menaquinone biosynthesis C-methylase UbiE
MRIEEYKNIFSQEGTHWWYRSMQDLVPRVFKKFSIIKGRSAVILDAGCGTGGMLRLLKKHFPGVDVIGIDYSAEALSYCGNGFNLLRASVASLPLAGESVDAVLCLDVLYHLNVKDDKIALREINRILKKSGYIFIHLPAFEFLRGSHDMVVRTRERYTVGKLRARLQGAGFEVVKCSYRHLFLFPLIFAKRIMERCFFRGSADSDLKPLPYLINAVLKLVSYSENRVLGVFSLPFGSSVICLARKPK